MQGDERLRACPFCGEEPALMSGGQGWVVTCIADDDVCDTSPGTWAKPTQAEAIAAWNRRAPAAVEGDFRCEHCGQRLMHDFPPVCYRCAHDDSVAPEYAARTASQEKPE